MIALRQLVLHTDGPFLDSFQRVVVKRIAMREEWHQIDGSRLRRDVKSI